MRSCFLIPRLHARESYVQGTKVLLVCCSKIKSRFWCTHVKTTVPFSLAKTKRIRPVAKVRERIANIIA